MTILERLNNACQGSGKGDKYGLLRSRLNQKPLTNPQELESVIH
jgi:hypothetical protein